MFVKYNKLLKYLPVLWLSTSLNVATSLFKTNMLQNMLQKLWVFDHVIHVSERKERKKLDSFE